MWCQKPPWKYLSLWHTRLFIQYFNGKILMPTLYLCRLQETSLLFAKQFHETPWHESIHWALIINYRQTSNTNRTLIGIKLLKTLRSWRLSALLQLHPHSLLNTWLQWIRQKQLLDETRNTQVLVFDASYTKCLTDHTPRKRNSPGREYKILTSIKTEQGTTICNLYFIQELSLLPHRILHVTLAVTKSILHYTGWIVILTLCWRGCCHHHLPQQDNWYINSSLPGVKYRRPFRWWVSECIYSLMNRMIANEYDYVWCYGIRRQTTFSTISDIILLWLWE